MNLSADLQQITSMLSAANTGTAMPTLARVFLVWLFPFSAIDKMIHWKGAVAQARSSLLPPSWAPVMLIAAMSAELLLPPAIVFGFWSQIAALVLAAYCAVTALLFHRFWSFGDFWSEGASVGRSHFWDFLKNFGLMGGLLLVSIGRGF